MFELKAISLEAIPEALKKAERYRLLGEPDHAASICQDILRIDSNNQDALIMLILCMTDQFEETLSSRQAQQLLPRLTGDYEKNYFAGIISERLGRAYMKHQGHGFSFQAHDCLREAMASFERAQQLRRSGEGEAILRWNTCARTLNSHPELRPRPEESYEPILGE